jgi:hypothetical protein
MGGSSLEGAAAGAVWADIMVSGRLGVLDMVIASLLSSSPNV